ncbi:MAG: L,D-transpeptidase [Deltaproteobacteria bacterium]|nr:L,D-transpeptidase [Deltaproteobacteria bacterium]
MPACKYSGPRAAILAAVLGACRPSGEAGGSAGGPARVGASSPSLAASAAAPADDSAQDAAADVLMYAPEVPVVDLDGVAHLPPPIPEGRPLIAALSWLVPIQAAPRPGAPKLGALRAGAVVERSAEPAGSDGCPGGWYAVEPTGYVCAGQDATLDLGHPVVRAASRRPDFAQRLPYMYGTCTRGGPIYGRIPTKADLAKHEPNLAPHLRRWREDEESGAGYGLDVWLRYTDHPAPGAIEAMEQGVTDPDIPWFLQDGAVVPNVSGLAGGVGAVKIGQIDHRVGRSFTHSFLYEGRRYNVTPDLVVIPADRLRPIRGSSFHGWPLGKELSFPFALVRRPGARKWMWSGRAKAMVDAGELAWRSAVPLTGKQRFSDGVLHFEAKDGFWVDDRHAGRVDPARRWPKWAKNGERWIDINLTKQVLVAHEGMTAVYATLVSTGEAGLADHETTTATIKGIFRIDTKWVTTTMDSDVVGEEFELRDVPYVQYFREGYAIHGAYWHDRLGQPKSHGCVNLSPEDARRLFWWTKPELPPRWHSASKALTGTVVFVHP